MMTDAAVAFLGGSDGSSAAVYSTRPSTATAPANDLIHHLPSAVLDEIGRTRGERFCTAIDALRSLPDSPCHRDAAAALTTMQAVLDHLTTRATTLSAATRTAVARAVLRALLLGDDNTVRGVSFCSISEDESAITESVSPAATRLARTVDALMWVVDAACSPLMSLLKEGGFAAVRCNGRSALDLWCEVAAHDAALLQLARLGLSSTSSGDCRWGAPVHAGVVRLLDALLQTSSALRIAADRVLAEKNGENVIVLPAEVEEAQRVALAATRLSSALTSDAILRGVAVQLHMPVLVLDEVDAFTRQLHTFVYDPLRHGVLSLREEVTESAEEGECRKAAAATNGAGRGSTSLVSWTLSDGMRCPQSPLELYSSAVAFLTRAASHRSAFPPHGDGTGTVAAPVWAAYVQVLERALQEGETALTLPAASTSASGGGGISGEGASVDCAVAEFVSPLVPRVRPFTTAHTARTAVPPHDAQLPDSEPASPCDSPVANPTDATTTAAAMPEKDAARTQRLAARDASSSCRSSASPTCLAQAEVGERVSPSLHADADMNEAQTPHEHNTCDEEHDPCEAEDSVRSNDVTVAGMTDAETTSICGGESAIHSFSAARSRPIAIASGKAATATTTTPVCTAAAAAPPLVGEPRSLTPSGPAKTARTSSPPSTCCSPTHNPVTQRREWSGGAALPGLSTSSPRQHPLRKSAMSPTTSANAAQRLSSLMDPLSLTGENEGRAAHIGSSKSSCLQRQRQGRSAAPALVRRAPLLRRVFPSHAQLTQEVLTALTRLSNPLSCAVDGMTALIDARVLTVMSGLVEYPGNTLQEVVMAIVENCFAFWETVVAQQPHLLLPSSPPQVAAGAAGERGATTAAAVLPSPLRACLSAFADFLGWDGEGWVALHAQYLQRALRLLIDVVEIVQVSSSPAATAAAAKMHKTAQRRHATTATVSPRLLVRVVHHLLSHNVIAHIWRCLSMDATQVPGAMGNSSSAKAGTAAALRNGYPAARAQSSTLDAFTLSSYGCFLYGPPSTVSCAVLSKAQCTAMQLLHTVAKALNWSAHRGAASASAFASMRAAGEVAGPVPDALTYRCFMEESLKHLAACANCLRRCTYTRSQSRPIVPDDHEALSRVLRVLRILFGAMGAGAWQADCTDVPSSSSSPASWAELRRAWLHQIADSQVLDVLAHIGTAAELVSFTLPRLSVFTLRSFLNNAFVLTGGPLVSVCGGANMSSSMASRARVGMAALQALVVDPPPPPATTTASTWGRGAVRESLLVILLARMQRRCAGQSSNASVPQRLEVFALLLDVLAPLVDSLPTSLSDASCETCRTMYDATTAAELVRVTQRVVAATIECRVWSGTAQELRYLDPSSTTHVKEALRFSLRVTQLVNGSLRALLCVSPSPPPMSTSSPNEVDTLGKRAASILLAESNSVVFAFHTVTMDLPLALAGLINGARWQTAAKTTTTATTTATSAHNSGSSSSSSSSSSGNVRRNGLAGDAVQHPRVGVTMTAATSNRLSRRASETEEATNEFADEDRRETCEVATCALVELLCVLRRVEAVLLSPAPLSPAVQAALPYRSGSHIMSSALVHSVRAVTALTAAESTMGDAAVVSAQYDVVVVQPSDADFAGVVTSTHYSRAAAALVGTSPNTSVTGVGDDAAAPAAASDAVSATTSTTTTTTTAAAAATADTENPRNWRQTEAQWRRRVPLLRAALKDALHAIDLGVLDRYLTLRERQVRRMNVAGLAGDEAAPWNVDAESRFAEGAVVLLAAEKKRYLKSL